MKIYPQSLAVSLICNCQTCVKVSYVTWRYMYDPTRVVQVRTTYRHQLGSKYRLPLGGITICLQMKRLSYQPTVVTSRILRFCMFWCNEHGFRMIKQKVWKSLFCAGWFYSSTTTLSTMMRVKYLYSVYLQLIYLWLRIVEAALSEQVLRQPSVEFRQY
jgi:hypothetical protein